jgi:DNA replication protein DnaC
MYDQFKDIYNAYTDLNILNIIYAVILFSLFQQLLKYVLIIGSHLKEIMVLHYENKKHKFVVTKSYQSKKKNSSILIERVYDNTENDSADALLDYITNYDGIRYIEYRKIYIVAHNDEVQIGNYNNREIYMRMISRSIDDKTNSIKNILFEIYSYKAELTELRKYMGEIVENYKIKKLNKLGDKVYYFDEVMTPLPIDIDGRIQYNNSPKTLRFNMTQFYTNKSLENMFGPDVDLVISRLRFFLNNKLWYAEKGIPYTFGLLLHGAPGCGKTSLVKAIANETGRHPFNIKFHDFLTQTQMNNLFFSDRIVINDSSDTYIIPQDKRLYSIEEIDCMSDLVLDRKLKDTLDEPPVQDENDPFQMLEVEQKPDVKNRVKLLSDKINNMRMNSEKLTTGFLLNLLDGVLEVPERILIMTTNYPEKLDKALIRPGRIDLILDFKKTTRVTIMEMYKHFYDLSDNQINERDFEDIDDYQYSPAEINQIFFKYIREPKEALRSLLL